MKQYDNALPKGTILQGTSCQYQIGQVLGQGSFGITYLASVKIVGALGTINANQQVAIKEFFMSDINQRTKEGTVEGMSEGSLSYKYKQRFRKEAENISKLSHLNIVKVVDFIEANDTFYYVMEYIDGEDLHHYMNDKPLPIDEAISIINEVGKALTYMHEEKNMLHLDLKPGNIMRRRSDGHIFLIDFGLTKIYADDGKPETSTTIGLGTPGYAPLEQSNPSSSKKSFGPTIDVYALGATLLKLLTAEPVPSASDVLNGDDVLEDMMSRHGVNENVKNAIIRAMDPKPKARLQSVKTLVTALSTTSSAKEKDSDATLFDSEVETMTSSGEVYDKDSVGLFREGFARVKGNNNKYGFIDKSGSLVIPCRWNDVMHFSEGLAGVMDEHFMWGFVNTEGIAVLPCKWKAVGMFSDGITKVKDGNGDWIDINKTGQRVKSYIDVKSEPVGASVAIDGKWIGTTPIKFEVTLGKHQVTVANGDSWSTFTKIVVVEKGETIVVQAHLDKKTYLEVTSNPTGASVYIDNSWRCRTPAKVEIAPGSHEIKYDLGIPSREVVTQHPPYMKEGHTYKIHADIGFVIRNTTSKLKDDGYQINAKSKQKKRIHLEYSIVSKLAQLLLFSICISLVMYYFDCMPDTLHDQLLCWEHSFQVNYPTISHYTDGLLVGIYLLVCFICYKQTVLSRKEKSLNLLSGVIAFVLIFPLFTGIAWLIPGIGEWLIGLFAPTERGYFFYIIQFCTALILSAYADWSDD